MYLLLYLGNYSGYLCTGHCEISRSTVDSSNISRHITSLLTPLSWQPWLTILKLLRFLLTDPRATCSLLISDTACNIIMITWSVLCISLFLHSTDIYYHVKFSPCTWLVHGMDGHYKNVLNEDKHSEKIWPAWGICIWRVRTRWWWGRGRGSPSWAGRCCSRAHPQTSSQGRSCNITPTISTQYLHNI